MHSECNIMHPMVDGTAALATVIGARVRHERQAHRWTLDHLADVAGVSRRTLVNVEKGEANPSVGTLLQLSDALGVGLPSLVEPPQATPLQVIRDGEGALLWTGEGGGRGVMVAGTHPPDVLELWDWTLGPGDAHTSAAHAAGTRELLQVRQGSLTVTAGDQTATLTSGDAVAFAGDVEHAYANTGRKRARFTLAVFEPDVGVGRPRAPGRPGTSAVSEADDA